MSLALFVCFVLVVQCLNAQQNSDPDWWKHAVFYQIYPLTFKDSDDDGIGDLQGIISKLDHLEDAGVTAVWLSPIYTSPQADQGYDISNFKDIDPVYGNLDDFDQLIKEAKDKNIKIIMDFVPNHSSNEHEWFNNSVNNIAGFEDFYVWKDGEPEKPPNNWISIFKNSAWKYDNTRKQYYLHQFSEAQPDLNYRSEALVEEMKGVLKFWLDRGVAGFRMDAVPMLFEDEECRDEPRSNIPNAMKDTTNYLRHVYTQDQPETFDMIYQFRSVLDKYTAKNGGDARIMMTEAYTDIHNTMYYYGNEASEGAHFTFNFFLITDLNRQSTATDIVSTVEKWLNNMPKKYTANWVIGNHDNNRVATRLGPENVDAYNMLTALLPGIMVTYNGEEIGQEDGEVTFNQGRDPNASSEEDFAKISRDFERTPFHWNSLLNAGFSDAKASQLWLPVSQKYKVTNLAAQQDPNVPSHYQIYKQLTALRQDATFKSGNIVIRAVTDNIVVFSRSLQVNTYLVIINIGVEDATITIDKGLFSLSEYLEVVIANAASERKKGNLIPTTDIQIKSHECLVAKKTTKVPPTTTAPPPTTKKTTMKPSTMAPNQTPASTTNTPSQNGGALLQISYLLVLTVCFYVITVNLFLGRSLIN